jgi:hypothetical protein
MSVSYDASWEEWNHFILPAQRTVKIECGLINARCVKACGRLLSAWHTPVPIETATWLGIHFFWKCVAVTGQASTSQKEHMLKCLSPAVT